MMSDLLSQMNPWHWLVFGLVLLLLELLGTAGYLLWLGISAIAVSILTFLLPISWSLQWVSFAVISLFTTWLWWRYQHKQDKKDDKLRTLNQRNEQLIGQTTILQEALVSGSGRVNLGDTTWAVRCNEDLPAGTKIVVIDVEGIILVVKAC